MGTPPPPRASHRVGIRRADVGGSKRRSAPYKALRPAGAADRAGRGESSVDSRAQAGEPSTVDSSRHPRPDCQDPQGSAARRLGKAVLAAPAGGDHTPSSRGRPGLRGTQGAPEEYPEGKQWPRTDVQRGSSGVRREATESKRPPYWAPTPGKANQSELLCSLSESPLSSATFSSVNPSCGA